MAMEIISKLKKRIKIMWVVIGTLIVLLATSSAYNIYYRTHNNTFENTTAAYNVPEKQRPLYIPQPEKRRKKV